MSVSPDFAPVAAPEAVVHIANARFTVLTDRLIRLEYHPKSHFEDRPSQGFWYRQQPVPQFSVRPSVDGVEIETDCLHLTYRSQNGSGFTAETLSIRLKTSGVIWHPGDIDTENLRGTTRTLDMVNGYTPLSAGLMSRAGWSVVDDSASLVFNKDGWLEPRPSESTDLYFFGYGQDYKACLRDYCLVSGKIPLIPRWILGNWWSRYWAYTQDELTGLISDFERYELPFSVCIVDMDWHITQTGNRSTGWTGYTWNRQLFPDPPGLLKFAHDRRLKIGLNLHPAEGVHPHEEQYPAMARRMGIDPTSGEPVAFDIADPAFVRAYFEVLHHPYEQMGVDFWWLDWQQGQTAAIPGLDPLWLINHLHFFDLGRDGQRRPFIFSRWGNQGHQRYPIGFSGDSYATWETLAFQPYMTATATNLAYGWWSHDIGGHMGGTEDSELFVRWVQFGVLSPINRIHATKGYFYDRRPWIFQDAEVLRVVREALQLRHAFIPYLYTMARLAHDESLPLLQPMYYEHPEDDAAYSCPQQYLFGTELLAAPFVTPADADTGLSRQVVWLPEGDWVHFFTGEYYPGGRWQPVYGLREDIPLFAGAGAIVPLGPKTGGAENPDTLNIHIFAGADNHFTLYEDDGETTAYLDHPACRTTMIQRWSDNRLEFSIEAPEGDTTLIPGQRRYDLYIHSVREDAVVAAEADGQRLLVTTAYDAATETLHVTGIQLGVGSRLRLTLEANGEALLSRRDRKAETILRLLRFFRLNTGVRNPLAEELDTILADPAKIAPYIVTLSASQGRALFEVLYDAGLHLIRDTHDPTLVLLWNNGQDERITYRYGDAYLHFGWIKSANHANGVAPRFTRFFPVANHWSHGARDEHIHLTQWQAQIDYDNLFTVIEHHHDATP